MRKLLTLGFLLAAFAEGVLGHEVRPAYLELRQTGAETYDVLWKVPGRGDDLRFGVYGRLPGTCRKISETRSTAIDNAFTDRWSVQCEGGLTGKDILIEGLSSSVIDVLVRVQRLDGTTQVTRLTPSAPSFTLEATPNKIQLASTYLVLGVEHILYGVDHLLFVLGLMLLVRDFRSLVKTITAFTVAHSITLAAATLGFIHVEVAPVEATIALSILFLSVELIRSQRGESSIAQRAPWIVAFAFGLLHGLGFASALGKMGCRTRIYRSRFCSSMLGLSWASSGS